MSTLREIIFQLSTIGKNNLQNQYTQTNIFMYITNLTLYPVYKMNIHFVIGFYQTTCNGTFDFRNDTKENLHYLCAVMTYCIPFL